jgi:hypothetical protein
MKEKNIYVVVVGCEGTAEPCIIGETAVGCQASRHRARNLSYLKNNQLVKK